MDPLIETILPMHIVAISVGSFRDRLAALEMREQMPFLLPVSENNLPFERVVEAIRNSPAARIPRTRF